MVHLSKYGGWTVKDLQSVLGLQYETKVSQSMEPWLDKAAKMYLADPTKFLAMVLYAAAERAPASESELDARIRMANGNLDRVTLFPQ